MSDPVVDTKQGKVKGKVSKNDNGVQFYSFKGMPFAKPPVGELRFAVSKLCFLTTSVLALLAFLLVGA